MSSKKKNSPATTTSRTGSATFRPRARIIQTLGRDLITNEVIAIQELIKNAYDADATEVILTFQEPLLSGDGEISIADNGDGMSLETIRGAWMEPATISKLRRLRTRSGRRVTGEKGIGRFAAARVAQVLEMTSLPRAGTQRVHVRFDWGRFEDPEQYLDEIKCNWRLEKVSKGAAHGTLLRLIKLNDDWYEGRFTNLRSELSRLVAPLTEDEFRIELRLPESLQSFAGPVTPPEVLGRPHYYLHGSLDSAGLLSATYEGPGGNTDLLEDDGTKPKILIPDSSGRRAPRCGPFEFELRVWDRQKEDLEPLANELHSTLRDIQRDLNAASGISVYRDHFRVLVPENDWLRLDLRRVQNPTMRLSNNQIVGRIFISADRNPGLKDQTNRQGIVDSPQLEDLKTALKEILSRLEVKRDNHRRGRKTTPAVPGIFEKLQIAPIRAYLLQRYPDDHELKTYLDQSAQTFEQGISEVQVVISRYRRLATLGQLIDVVLHEGRTPVSTIKGEAELGLEDLDKTEAARAGQRTATLPKERFLRIVEQSDVLALLFKRLAPFSGRMRGRPVRTTMEKIIADTFALHQKEIADGHVSIELPTGQTPVSVDPAEMQMIFLNLLENALYWLERVPPEDRKILVGVQRFHDGLVVTFSDSGPGVAEDARERIFDPYFSTKPEGVGLGLTVAGETSAEYDGSLELIASGPLPGATFKVVLRKGVEVANG
jgi:signal transduction histidine kinase